MLQSAIGGRSYVADWSRGGNICCRASLVLEVMAQIVLGARSYVAECY